MQSPALIAEPPLLVLPSLANAVGLNEAIFLQQLHYWCNNPRVGKEHDGRKWVRNTIDEWRETNFPFWSKRSIERLIEKLKKNGYLLHLPLGKHPFDRANYYSIDYDKLDETMPSGWREPSRQSGAMQSATSARSLTETTTETTTESKSASSKYHLFAWELADYLDDELKEHGLLSAAELRKPRQQRLTQAAGVFDKLHRIDGEAPERIWKIMRSLFDPHHRNHWWISGGNLRSARKLRRKTKHGDETVYERLAFDYDHPRKQANGKARPTLEQLADTQKRAIELSRQMGIE